MKVTHAKTRILQTPADHPLVKGLPTGDATREFVSLELGTDEGVEGIGVTFFGWALVGALRAAVDALAGLVIGEDPLRTEAVVDKLWQAGSGSGPGGIFSLALAAIDIALWDIKGKALDQSLCTLLGGHRRRVPTYASGALMRTFPLDYLAGEAARLVEMGFSQIKMQLGGEATVAGELERARVVREAVGDDVDLMCDINQRWQVYQAIRIGRRLEPFHLFWLEDVVVADDYPGQARVARALATPIAAGEYTYGIVPFRHMLEARSVDIVMCDLLRVGGITQWLKVAAMAQAFNLPVVSHVLPEIFVHLIAAIPHGLTVEYMPWTNRLFEEIPLPVDGYLEVPDKPGLGLAFDMAAIKRYQVA